MNVMKKYNLFLSLFLSVFLSNFSCAMNDVDYFALPSLFSREKSPPVINEKTLPIDVAVQTPPCLFGQISIFHYNIQCQEGTPPPCQDGTPPHLSQCSTPPASVMLPPSSFCRLYELAEASSEALGNMHNSTYNSHSMKALLQECKKERDALQRSEQLIKRVQHRRKIK